MRMMNEFEAQVISDLSVLKSQMAGLMATVTADVWPIWNAAWIATSRTGNAPRAFLRRLACCSQ